MKKHFPIIKDQITTERFVIPYRVYGNGGPQLVCLNGVQQSMAMWHSFICRFSKDYRIVVFDFPGQGKAETLQGNGNVSIEEQVEILYKVIEAAGVSRVTLCSASWGGVVAMIFAARYPKLVRRLILAGMGTRPNKKMVETIEQGCLIDPEDRKELAQSLIKSFGENLPDHMKEKITRQFSSMTKETLQAFYEHGLFVITAQDLRSVVDLKNIKVETILLNGENDAIIDLDDVKFLASQIPGCRMKIVKNVGHFLHLEDEGVLDIYHEVLPALNEHKANH